MRTVHGVWNALVTRADYLVDLHGGDLPEYQVDYAICFETGNREVDDISKRMAKHFGASYIRTSPRSEGGNKTGPAARMAMEICGIPAIVTEVGDGGKLSEERYKKNVAGLMNVVRLLGMMPGSLEPIPPEQREMVSRAAVLATQSGLSHLRVKIGQAVEKGEVLVEIRNELGEAVEDILSPITGDVVQLFYQGWINEGEIAAKIAALAQEVEE